MNDPTGGREDRVDGPHLVWTRTFHAPIAAVWAAVTEPERLQRWIGTWTGDPATGTVDFMMTAEGEDCEAEVHVIEACEPPRRLVTRSPGQDSDQEWWLTLDLQEKEHGITTLTFAQAVTRPGTAGSVGPGWEYYLDRLVAAETGAGVEQIDWQDYYPSQSTYYHSLFD